MEMNFNLFCLRTCAKKLNICCLRKKEEEEVGGNIALFIQDLQFI